MAWICNSCDKEFDAPPSTTSTGAWKCPICDADVQLASAVVSPPASESMADEPADTVFQPVLMMESIMEELTAEPAGPENTAPTSEPGTETLETDPSTLPSPFLELEVEAYLLILGASPGQERRPLVRAKTLFGRKVFIVMTLTGTSYGKRTLASFIQDPTTPRIWNGALPVHR